MKEKPGHLVIYFQDEIRQSLVANQPFRTNRSYIMMIKSGRFVIKYNLTQYTLTSGSVLFINHSIVYEFIETDALAGVCIIAIDPAHSSVTSIKIRNQNLFSVFHHSTKYNFHISDTEMNELWSMAQLLKQKNQSSNTGKRAEQSINHLFLSLIYSLADMAERYIQTRITEKGRIDQLTIDFLNLVLTHVKQEKQLAFYAQQLGITPKHMSETIKANSGHTAGELIDAALLSEAKIMLANPFVNIKQTSQELGFNDQYTFSKFFKRIAGMSPSEYKATTEQGQLI